MVTSKNVISVIKQSLLILAVVSIQWVVVGYSLVFGTDFHGIIGGLNFFGLQGVGYAPSAYAPTIPQSAFMIFQAMGAIIAPALIIGSIVERVRFRTLVIFVLLWTTLVYDPIAHWVWGTGGWLHNLGTLDFAGGTLCAYHVQDFQGWQRRLSLASAETSRLVKPLLPTIFPLYCSVLGFSGSAWLALTEAVLWPPLRWP